MLHILGNILAALQRGRTSLVIPKKKPIDELMKSRNMVWFFENMNEKFDNVCLFFFYFFVEVTVTKSAR